MAASDASSSHERRRSAREADRHGDESALQDRGKDDRGSAGIPVAEDMPVPSVRLLPTEPEAVICVAAKVILQEEPPFHLRRGMTTIRPQLVDQKGAARLYCDCLHDGEHEWPPVYHRIIGEGEESGSGR